MEPDPVLDRAAYLVSEARFAVYLGAAGGDRSAALELYEWNVALSAACFEAFHYVEIVVRNAIDRELAARFDEDRREIPWFLLEIVEDQKARKALEESVARVRSRLRAQNTGRDTRAQIVAGTDFGFWTELLHGQYESLWREAAHKAFPGSSGRRKDVLPVLDKLRVFRNRLAHHDSLLVVDVPAYLDDMLLVLGWIDPSAAEWLRRTQRIESVYRARPVAPADTVVVPAREAWPLYMETGAYVCQPGRTFRPVDRIAFYADGEVKADVPKVLRRWDQVEWSTHEAARLSRGDADDRRLSEILLSTLPFASRMGRAQIFDLTRPGHPDHKTLSSPIPHHGRGRGSAFVQRQRYTSMADLTRAASTADL